MATDWEDIPSVGDGWEDIPNDSSFGEKAIGALDAAATMFAGTPAQIAGGLHGLSTLLAGQGLDKANENLEKTTRSNFGFGEYTPMTKKGEEFSGAVSSALEKPVELAGDFGERIAGNEGRLAGELWTRSAMELVDPLVLAGVGGRALTKRKVKPNLSKDKQALADMESGWEDVPASTGNNVDLDLSDGPNLPDTIPVTREGQGALTTQDLDFREDAIAKQRAEQVANMSNETQQTELFDQPESGRVPMESEAVLGDWRIDENGMPIKADLSMEAANLENPLQRNLFGDELAQKHPQEADLGITQAMDQTRNDAMNAEDLQTAEDNLRLMQEQQDLLSFEIRTDPRMQRAMRDSELRANTPLSESPMLDTKRPISSKGKIGRQRGAVNPALFDPAYKAVKKIGNYTLRLLGGERGPTINLYDERGVHAGWLDVEPKYTGHEQNMEAKHVHVRKEHQGQGLAQEMYKFLAEQGNDIKKSDFLLDDGKAMWNAFERKGFSKGGMIPRGQRGNATLRTIGTAATAGGLGAAMFADDEDSRNIGLGIAALGAFGSLPSKNPLKKMKKQYDGTMIPDDPTPEQLEESIAVARGEKDGKSATYMDSGSTLTALKRGSTAIRLAGELVQNAFKRAELMDRNHVFPAERALRKLNTEQMDRLGHLFKHEMFKGQRATPEQLAMFTPEIQNAYRIMREMFDHSLEVQNAARAAKGQDPITPMEAYLSSRWQGDFRRPLYNKDGKLVWYLADNTKMGLNAQTRAVLKDFPDLTYDPKKDHTVRFWNRKTDLESAYTTMLDILKDSDPAVQALKSYMEDQTVGRGATFLNQEKHFKRKGNIRGFVGDRPELTLADFTDKNIPFGLGDKVKVAHSRKNDILNMFEQQIQYAKNAHRWSEMQIAGQSLKKIINDPYLVEHQPNNIKYIREYFKNAIGYGESKWARITADTMRDLGVSPEPLDKGVGSMKSYFILTKLAANAGYATANAVQLGMTLPHMADLFSKGYRANPLRAYTAGILGGFLMGTGHYANMLGGKMPDIPGADFFNNLAKYAEDNGITARSVYDEAPLANSFSKLGPLKRGAGLTMTMPETFLRSMAFTTMAQYLKDTGKFKSELEIFKEAERRVNASMVDYRASERPMVFSKLGTAGNFLNTLQTFSWNYWNQFKYFWNEASKRNVIPIAAFLMTQFIMAGAMGIPGVEDTHKLLMSMKDMLPAPTWKKIQDNEFLSEPKLWLLKKSGGQSAVYGYLSDKSGLGLTSRVSAPGIGQMFSSPLGPITDIGRQVGSVASLAIDPTNRTKQAQALMDVAPTGLKGLLETAPFMEDQTFVNRTNPQTGETERVYKRPTKLAERTGLITRTPEEETTRKFGFGLRRQSEVVKRDVAYATKRDTDSARQHARDIPDVFYDALRRNDKEKAKEYYQTYTYITGNKISKDSIKNQALQEFLTDAERQKLRAGKTVQALINVKRMEDLYDAIEKESK